MENVVTDVHELEKGMEAVKKEYELRGKGPHNHVLKDFLSNSEDKLKKTKVDAKNAQVIFFCRLTNFFLAMYNSF